MPTKKKPAAKAPKKKPAAPKKAGKPAAKKPAEKKPAAKAPATPAPAASKTLAPVPEKPLTPEEVKLRINLEAEAKTGMATFRKVGHALLEINDKRLWRGDYASFQEYLIAEFDLDRSEAYRYIGAEKLALQVEKAGLPAPLNRKVAQTLEQVPQEARTEVYREAVENAGGKAPTVAEVKQVVDEHKSTETSTTTTTTSAPKDTFGFSDEVLKKDEALNTALATIGKTLTPQVAKAIKQGVIPMKRADVFTLAAMHPDDMKRHEKLISIHRWDLKKAIRFLEAMPDEKTTVETLINLTIAEGGEYEATINGYTIRVIGKKTK